MNTLDIDILRKHLEIVGGRLVWKLPTSRSVKRGDMAGSLSSQGYFQLAIMGKKYKAHRVIWALTYNEWPLLHLDHINGVKTDNKIENLREATVAQNLANIKKTKGASRYKGVCWNKGKGKWMAQISQRSKQKYLGLFESENAAALAYDVAANEIHGEFAALNFGSAV